MNEKKHAILAINDRIGTPIEIPEWGAVGGLCIRFISGAERDELEIAASKINDGDVEAARGFRARAAALFLGDAETGERIFDDDDVEELGRKSGAALERIRAEGYTVNGYSADEVDELEGNSGGRGTNGDSGFDSPSPSADRLQSCNSI